MRADLSPAARRALSSGLPLAEVRAAGLRERAARLARIAGAPEPAPVVCRPRCKIPAACRAAGAGHCRMCAGMAHRDRRPIEQPDPEVVAAAVDTSRVKMREGLERAAAARPPRGRPASEAVAAIHLDNLFRGLAARPSLYLTDPTC